LNCCVGLYADNLTESVRLHADKKWHRLENCGKAGLRSDGTVRNVGLRLDQNMKNTMEMARVSADFGSFARKKRGQKSIISTAV
jgi:hypothetical protein